MDKSIRDAIARIKVSAGSEPIRGTGFLVAPDLVLTALHVVADRTADPPVFSQGSIRLQFPERETEAEVFGNHWGRDADWVLLRCSDAPKCQPIPLVDLEASGGEWETYGFPDAQPVDGMAMTGTVTNHRGELNKVPAFQLYCQEAGAGDGGPVRGLSGAPVLIGGAAAGLLRFALMRDGKTVAGTVYACPSRAIVEACSEILRLRDPIAPRSALRDAFKPLIEDRTRLFAGREAFRAKIEETIQGPAAGYTVVTAPSGMGKTALMASLVSGHQDVWAYHFFTPVYGDSSLTEAFFLRNVVEQMTWWHPDEGEIPTQLDDLRAMYHRLLQAPLEATRVLVLDGLDEVTQWKLAPYLSRHLPARLHILVTLRDLGQDWQSEYRFPTEQLTHLPLAGLTRDEVAQVLRAAGPGAAVIADNRLLLDEVMGVSAYQADGSIGADPMYVRLLAEDAAVGRLTPENIRAQPHGLVAYLDQWWNQVKNMAGEGPARDLFGSLTVALGPIGRVELEAINARLRDDWAADFFDEVLNKVRRWVVGDAERGYTLAHPRLRDYMRSRIKTGDYLERLLDYCAGWQQHKSSYALQHRAAHLTAAGRWKPLAQMFAEGDFMVARGERFGFAAVYSDALSAVRSPNLSSEWRDPFAAWEHFLRWRIERLESFPRAYAGEVVNEFLPNAAEPLASALAPLRERFLQSPFRLKKTFGPPALGGGPTGTVYSAAFSPDARFIALGSDDWTVRVWDTEAGEVSAQCFGHRAAVLSVAYSPDGRLLASGGADQTVKIWEAGSGHLVANCGGQLGFIFTVAFSPDGHLVASGGGPITVWDPETGRAVANCRGFDGAVNALAFSTDGRLIAAGCRDGAIRAWETQSGDLVSELRNAGSVHALCFLPGSYHVISGSYQRTVMISDAQSGTQIASHLTRESIRKVAVSPDGRLAACAGVANSIDLLEAASARPLWKLVGHQEPILQIDFPSNDKLVCHCPGRSYSIDPSSALTPRNACTAQLWDTNTGALLEELTADSKLLSLDASSDFRLLLAGYDNHIAQLWSRETRQLISSLAGHTGPVKGVGLSPDGRLVATASADKTVGIWDAQTGTRRSACTGHFDEVNCVVFSQDGSTVVSGGNDGRIKEWDAHSGLLIRDHSLEPASPVRRVSFDRDGKPIAAGLPAFSVKITTLADNGVKMIKQEQIESGMVCSPDDRFFADLTTYVKWWGNSVEWRTLVKAARVTRIDNIAASTDGGTMALYDQGIVLVDAASGKERARFACEADSHAIAFSPDRRFIASAGSDNLIRVWETATGQLIRSLKAEHGPLTSLAISDGEPRVAAGGHQGVIVVWNLSSGQLIAKAGTDLRHVTSVAFFPLGQYVAGGSNAVYVWQADTGAPAAGFEPPEDPAGAALRPLGLFLGMLDTAEIVPIAGSRLNPQVGG